MRKIELIAIVAIVIATLIIGWVILAPSYKKPAYTPVVTTPTSEPAPSISEEEEVVPVRALKAQAKDFEDALPVLGTVKGYAEIPLKFEVSGVVKTLNVREGSRVKKGDLIATLDDKDAKLKLNYALKKTESAKAQYLSANKKKELYEGLYKAGAVIKQKLEEAALEAEAVKSQVGMAEAEWQIADSELHKNNLLSPKDGIIGSKDVEVGEFITSQNKIVSLFDIQKVYVELGIVEKDIEKVKLGQKTEVQLDSYPQKTFLGKIENLLPIIEGKSRTLTAKVLLDNPESLLLPGMFSRAKVYIVELKEVILVPKTSILNIGLDVTIVPIINPGVYKLEDIEKGDLPATVELRKVTLGHVGTDYAQVAEGLTPGDLVVIESRGELKEGLKVKVVEVQEALF